MQIKRHASIRWVVLILIATWGCTELSDDHNVHPDNWSIEHQAKIRTVGYDLISCKSCHGDDLGGSDEVPGCSGETCHQVEAGQSALDAIYACDNCHGYLGDDLFKDVVGNTSWDILTVGMHTSHYQHPHALTDTVNVNCGSCHVLPDSVWAPGHIDDTPYAEVTFDSLATAGGTLFPMWDREAATCSDTYCHGNFVWEKDSSDIQFAYADSVIAGNNLTANWTQLYTGDNFCTTCHGLPPIGHVQNYVLCGLCHSSVVSDQDHRTIIDPAKHINGLKN